MNPPFQPPAFAPGPPTTPVRENGPVGFPSYNGQSQSSFINARYLPPPSSPAVCTYPHAAVGMSQIP